MTAKWPYKGAGDPCRRRVRFMAGGRSRLRPRGRGGLVRSGGSSGGGCQQRQGDHHRTGLLHHRWQQHRRERYNKQFEKAHPNVTIKREVRALRQPDHQGAAGRQRRRHAEHRDARQPERSPGRGHRPARPVQQPARFHHQRAIPGRHHRVHVPGQAVLLPDRHQHCRHLLQQGDAGRGGRSAAHDLGRAAVRRQEADQGRDYGIAFDATATSSPPGSWSRSSGARAATWTRWTLRRGSSPCSCGSTWSRTAPRPSPCSSGARTPDLIQQFTTARPRPSSRTARGSSPS